MTTNNIISTPNITGNIGSCTTNSTDFVSGRDSIWTTTHTVVTTNSCNGQTQYYEYWQVSVFFGTLLITGVLFIIFILMVMADSETYC